MASSFLPRAVHFVKENAVWPGCLNLIVGLVLVTGLAVSFKFVQNYYSSPLKSFPGPLCTNFTDLWRYFKTAGGSVHLVHADLHRKYGPAVRVGPNALSLSDPSLLKLVYNTKNPWKKSNMYKVQESVRPDGTSQPNLFSTSDEKWHATVMRPVSSYLSSNKSVLSVEKFLDNSIALLLRILNEKFVNTGRPCDIADWFVRFSWDAMGDTTFGAPLGFLDGSLKNSEVLLRDSDRDFDYFAKTSQMPWLHYILKTNRIARALRAPQLEWAVNLSFGHYSKRLQMRTQQQNEKPETKIQHDFLDKYLEAQQKYPELIDHGQMIGYLLTNTVAGSHPAAYTLTALVYYVLKTKGVYEKIGDELASVGLLGFSEPVSYKQAKSLVYLEAVIREAIRIHPGFSLILEREVPAELGESGEKGNGHSGLVLPDGRFVPSGTIVGMDAWVINRNEDIFGPNPDSFVPERWLPFHDERRDFAEYRLKKMFNTVLSFGMGARIELVNPDKEMKITNSWTLRTEDVELVLRRNQSNAKVRQALCLK
ncbi:hypothetical protein UA08_02919 [Talaromyces atroroseus]|uniref:Cytochrome P450 n=1 Tax=Talaromyces atroroseus TaxID=1441469 RepID=A0A225B3Z8_TALAT|nr:hypothetical protein UA08_02919 [Talaromyces atroroseus]OKL62006.1 hypothetical protein UA08_02919 [Talaromyces atroroseus]